MPLRDLPPEARPREKLLAHGAGALSDVELLAVLLRTGLPGLGVMALAQSLLDGAAWPDPTPAAPSSPPGLGRLLQTDAAQLARVKGLGPAKRAELLAVLELARRASLAQLRERTVLDQPDKVKQHLQLTLGQRPFEVFAVLFLDAQHRLIALEELFRGSLTQTSVYPRVVAQRALQLGAHALVLAHNHPSGSVQPSAADLSLTQALKAALALLDVAVLDHVIVAPGLALSMAEKGLI